jgi:hypothetical protein
VIILFVVVYSQPPVPGIPVYIAIFVQSRTLNRYEQTVFNPFCKRHLDNLDFSNYLCHNYNRTFSSISTSVLFLSDTALAGLHDPKSGTDRNTALLAVLVGVIERLAS